LVTSLLFCGVVYVQVAANGVHKLDFARVGATEFRLMVAAWVLIVNAFSLEDLVNYIPVHEGPLAHAASTKHAQRRAVPDTNADKADIAELGNGGNRRRWNQSRVRYVTLPPRRPKIAAVPIVHTGNSAERMVCWVGFGYLMRKLWTARTPRLESVSPRRAGQKMEIAVPQRTAIGWPLTRSPRPTPEILDPMTPGEALMEEFERAKAADREPRVDGMAQLVTDSLALLNDSKACVARHNAPSNENADEETTAT
jgi:hypothetical protein